MAHLSLLAVFGGFITNVMAQDVPDYFDKVVEAHGITGSIAWVFLLTLAAILRRVLPDSTSFWMHVCFAFLALALIISNAGMGIWQAVSTDQLDVNHSIIGLVIFCFAMLQPVWGWTQHAAKVQKGRTMWGHIHIWFGRAIITLGMVNGGLGLLLGGGSTRSENIAYGVVAGIIWLAWITVSVQYEIRRAKFPDSAATSPEGVLSQSPLAVSVAGDDEEKK